jgi:predicted aspartyl protease
LNEDLVTEALVDTGFDGDILLPQLRLTTSAGVGVRRSFRVGDGRVVNIPTYPADIQVVGLDAILRVSVGLGSPEVIVGRGVIDYFRVIFDHGREVVVEP